MQASQFFGGSYVTTKAGLTGISGAATTFTTANAQVAAIGGKAIAKAAVAGGATPTTDAVTGSAITLTAGYGTVVVWALDASGNVKAVKGSTETLDSAGNFNVAPQLPNVQDNLAPFAYTTHKAGSTTVGTWTFGVSNWNATGLTHTVVDVLTLPQRPQTA
jgi:hypothetical protein